MKEENEMKHKHYEMIVAKAANMDLELFFKDSVEAWKPCTVSYIIHDNEALTEFFACLPQHKEAVLHSLNGGESVSDDGNGDWCLSSTELWHKDWWYMCESYESKVKPKKEKRWIGTCKNFVTSLNYPSIGECKDAVGDDTSWQFHEIEVEV